MGITSKKQQELPNRFQTIPAFDNTVRQPKTGIGVPSEEAVNELKEFVHVNKQ
ncbi:MAG: hypothetical protein FWG38_02440 [Defluviitaleaceae bacterium]|jgi:hypothetical protein|nr:hypothetical protein [Defluviitaleaceae bacterium]